MELRTYIDIIQLYSMDPSNNYDAAEWVMWDRVGKYYESLLEYHPTNTYVIDLAKKITQKLVNIAVNKEEVYDFQLDDIYADTRKLAKETVYQGSMALDVMGAERLRIFISSVMEVVTELWFGDQHVKVPTEVF